MKFSHSVQFNAVPDWSSHYIAYSNLKKLIYSLEKQAVQNGVTTAGDTERSALISERVDTDAVFTRALDAELDKISSFYSRKEKELFDEVLELEKDARVFEHEQTPEFSLSDSQVLGQEDQRARSGSGHDRWQNNESRDNLQEYDESDDDEDAESGAGEELLRGKDSKAWRNMNRAQSRGSMRSEAASEGSAAGGRRRMSIFEDDTYSTMNMLYDMRVTLKKRAISLFVALRELKSYAQLNRTGFRKATKKYDKTLDRDLKSTYTERRVAPAYCFQADTAQTLDEQLLRIETLYADLVTNGDVEVAKRELRLHLREHVVWERNTVWREMIGIERKANAAHMGMGSALLGDETEKTRRAGDGDSIKSKVLRTPFGRMRVPVWLFSSGFFSLTAIVLIFAVLLQIKIFKTPEQNNCFAMLVFVSLLWATEVIPLFVTSLLIPFLVVLLGVVREEKSPHKRMDTKTATKYIFSAMWTPVIMLLLGGFALAAALSKYGIAKRMATFVLAKAGTEPRAVLLTNMFVAMFASMWISNVAAPVLCFSIIQPMLRNLPSDSDFSKALILGIALASNIGGMASPIASPQNIIALENMSPAPSWGMWFFVALPVCVISILLVWTLLLVTFRTGKGTTIVSIRPVRDPFSGVEWFITITALGTIVLWCVSHQLEHIFGDMGVIAIIPLVLFFGSGVLTKEDFNNFLWTIIILAAGGLSLGKAVNSSGLLHTIAHAIRRRTEGLSLYAVLCVFCSLILVIATFISHTVAALIILPVVAQVGNAMGDGQHARVLVMGSALMCSAAMGLPTSGFPNMTAIMMEDGAGVRYLRVQHFITRGVLGSFMTFMVVVTVGYGLMWIAGM